MNTLGLTNEKGEIKKATVSNLLDFAGYKDRMQGDALLKAKKLICEDEWDVQINKMNKQKAGNWKSFLRHLDLWEDTKRSAKRSVRDLLDFAGYKEI